MVDITESLTGKYLNAEAVMKSSSKKIVILTEGEYREETFDGKKHNLFYLKVSMDKKEYEYRPNRDSLVNLAALWGSQTSDWIGKVASVQRVTMNGKDTVLAVPIGQ